MDKIKIGDLVSWRNANHPGALGILHCEVIALGKTELEEDAATLKVFGGTVNALVSDLQPEAVSTRVTTNTADTRPSNTNTSNI